MKGDVGEFVSGTRHVPQGSLVVSIYSETESVRVLSFHQGILCANVHIVRKRDSERVKPDQNRLFHKRAERANPVLHFQELCLETERRWDIMSDIRCQKAGIRTKVGPQICVGVMSKLAPFTLCLEALRETRTRQKPCAGLQDAHCSTAYASSKLSAGLAAQRVFLQDLKLKITLWSPSIKC